LTLILYIRTYQLLNPSNFRKVLIVYHRRKVLERVYQELFKRVKQNTSIRFVEELGIEASLFEHNYPGRIGIEIREGPEGTKVVEDINLNLIGLSVENAKKLSENFQREQFTFSGLPGRTLSSDYPEIASIVPELNQKPIILPLRRAIRTIPWSSAKLESASDDLLINRDLVSAAIISGQADNVELSLNLYIETIEAFLDSLQQLGYRFTPELAVSEGKWFNRWDIFETVYQQYVSLVQEALKSDNFQIINEFVGFPFHVMAKAFHYQDHFAFRQFANLYPYIYLLSKQHISDGRTKDQIADRCGRLLAEFASYQVERRLTQKEVDEEGASELIAYAESILAVFSQLAKYQIDNRDYSHFRLTVGSIQRLLKDFIHKHDEYKISHLELQIEYADNEELRRKSKLELKNEMKLNSLSLNLLNKRSSALFGLGTWICHLVDMGIFSVDEFEKFTKPINHEFGSISVLCDSHTIAISMEDRNRFNWSGWEMDEWPDEAYGEGKFGSMHFSSWLSYYYAYRALELTPENPDSILDIKPTPDIKGILDSTKSSIEHFLENKSWEGTIVKLGNFKLRSEILINSLGAAHAKQLEIEEIEITQIPISDEKVKTFIDDTEKTWKEQGVFRNLFIVYGKYYPRIDTSPPKELLPYGIYQRIPKGVFIEHPTIGYPMWGESYGRSMAQSEDRLISGSFGQLTYISADLEEFDDVIQRNMSSLQTKGFSPIILYGHKLHRQFFESKYYEPKWRTAKSGPKGIKNLDGFYKDAVVIRYSFNPTDVIIFDPEKFGDLVQSKVEEDKPDFPFLFSITEISKERAKEYLVKNPELRNHPETGEKLSKDDAIRRLQQDVELAIWQRIRIENVNPDSGIVVKFETQGDDG